MPELAGTDPTLGTGSSVGKYFAVVSVIPSVVLTGWVYLLYAMGSFHENPNLDALKGHNPFTHPSYLAAVAVTALLLALVGHPIQFALVQLLEGYWGTGRFAANLRTRLVMGHLTRLADAARRRSGAEKDLRRLPRTLSGSMNEHLNASALKRDPITARAVVNLQGRADAANVLIGRYPKARLHTMPTMLGNVLRRHEQLAGAAVNLPVLIWADHIGMVAEPSHTSYLNDQRTQMDLAARMTAATFIASVVTFGVLWQRDGWALLTFAPLCATWLSYRGAVVSADNYGSALQAWVDLNRHRLYEALHLPATTTPEQERTQNKALVDLAVGNDTFTVPPNPATDERARHP